MFLFFLLFIFSFQSILSTPQNYLLLLQEQNIPFDSQPLQSSYIPCSNDNPLACNTQAQLPPGPFYMINTDTEYTCLPNTGTSWECHHKILNSRNIFECNIFSRQSNLINSTAVIKSKETFTDCYSSDSFRISRPYSSSIKVALHELYPMVKEYKIIKDQKVFLMPIFGFSGMKAASLMNGNKYPVKTKEYSFYAEINQHQNILIDSQNTTKISLELFQEKSLVFHFEMKLEIVHEDIEAYYQGDMIYVVLRQLNSQFSYVIVSENRNITAKCIQQIHAIYEIPAILECSMNEKTAFASQKWQLITLEDETKSKLFSLRPSKTGSLVTANGKIMDKKTLILTVDSGLLSSWFIEFGGSTIIECNFFNNQSTLGFILNSNRIACPLLSQGEYINDNIFDVEINLSESSVLINVPRPPRMLQTEILYAFSILNPLIIVEPARKDFDTSRIRTFNVLQAIFDLNAFSAALVTIDLRFLSQYEDNFVYGEDWEISITVGNNLSFDDLIPIVMPEIFLSEDYSKAQVHEFVLTANVDLQFKVDVTIHNDSYLSTRYAFIESASVEISSPYRARFNEQVAFYAMIIPGSGVALPTNMPLFDSNRNQPNYQLSLGSIRSGFDDRDLKQHKLTSGVNLFNPETLYWGTQDYATMIYLPFFSNCQAFDKYINMFSLFEQSENCDLIPPEETIYIKPFGFGSVPTADSCSEVEFSCIIDEDINLNNPSTPRWFEQGPSTLFYVTKSPHSADTMNSDSINSDTNNFIPVSVSGDYEDGKLPSLVEVQFDYYQLSPTEKRMVTGTVTLSNFITPTAAQANGTEPFAYTLSISLVPLDHTSLLIAFEFEYYVYLVLYFAIGSVTVMKTGLMTIYFICTSRDRKKLTFKYWCIVKLAVPPILRAMCLAMLALTPIIIILSALMVGEIWKWPIHSCGNSDSECYHSVFDVFALEADGITDRSSSEFTNLRNGRAGIAFIVLGAMMIFLISHAFMTKPERLKKKEQKVAFDGNVWSTSFWSRTAMVNYCALHIIWYMILIQFSFTDLFGDNVYVFTGMMKIVGVITGEIGESMLGDKFLMLPILMMHELMESLITFGASDFLEYIISNFMELAIQTFSRVFLGSIVETVLPYVEDKISQASKFIKRSIFDAEESDDSSDDSGSDDEKEKEKDKKATDDNPNKSSSGSSNDSNIILSDQDDSVNTSVSASLIVDMDIKSDLSESGDEFEREVKRRLENKEKEKHKHALGDHHGTTHAHVLDDEEVKNSSLEKLADISIESQAVIFTPFSTLVLWMFYSVNNLVPNYGIAEPDIIFYLLYSLVIIPFQLSNDVLHYNIGEFYHGEKVYEYLVHVTGRYKTRKTAWKGQDDDIDEDIEEECLGMDRMCFSSQYFFLMIISTAGVYFMMLGAFTIITAEYNPFNDIAAFYTLVVFILLSVAVYYATFYSGKFLKVWSVDTSDKSDSPNTTNAKSEESVISEDGIAGNLVLRNINNWSNVDKAHDFKERLHEITKGLHSANFDDIKFKTDMIKSNFYWFNSNLKEVFTPTTLKGKRKNIIQSFKQIYGELSPRVLHEENNNESPTKYVDQREKKIIKKSLPHAFISLLKQWKTRASLIRKIRSQVAGIVESSTGIRCEFCFTNQSLRAELVSNIEDIFIKFLQDDPSQNTVIWSIEKWQDTFKKNMLIRTLCFECYTEILDHHIETSVQETVKQRVNERRRKNPNASMIDRRGSKRMSREDSQLYSRIEPRGIASIETEESNIIEGQGTNPSNPSALDFRDTPTVMDSRDKKMEARRRLVENENVKNFLKGWLEVARERVNPPETFR